MTQHWPGTVWGLRRFDSRMPEGCKNGVVRTLLDGYVLIEYGTGDDFKYLKLKRADAKLLAKRINECLETTR